MTNPDDKQWALRMEVRDATGVLARCCLLFRRFAVNIDFARFGPARDGISFGLFEFGGNASTAHRLMRKLESLVEVIAVEVVELNDVKGGFSIDGRPDRASGPRELDDLLRIGLGAATGVREGTHTRTPWIPCVARSCRRGAGHRPPSRPSHRDDRVGELAVTWTRGPDP